MGSVEVQGIGTKDMRRRHGNRALVTAFAVLVASFGVWAAPPVRFAAPINSPIGTLDAIAIVAADFNGDGILDIADGAFNNRSLEILIGAGDGTFLPKTNYFVLGYSSRITVADFNNDKKPDLAFGGSAFLGTGDGGFVAVNIFTNSDTRHGWILGGGDFTGDGNADLICVQPDSLIDPQGDLLTVWAGNGAGGFSALTNYSNLGVVSNNPFDGAAVDLNADSRLDMVVYYRMPGSLNVLLGGGDGSFLMATNYNLDPMGGVLSVGDFNGDAKPDLAVVTDPSYLRLLLGDGTGAFMNVTNYDRHLIGGTVEVGDINGDGKADVVMATGGSSVSVFAGNGDGTFSLAFDQESGLIFYTDVELADVNGDGRLDIVVCSGGTVSVLLNQTLPALEADLIGEQIRLVWPAWNGFMLESTTNFSTTNTWVALTNQPVLINNQRVLTNSIADGQRYFRLRKP